MIERRYSFDRVGYSYRATELEAAIALSEFERWERTIAARRLNARILTEQLSDLSVLQLPKTPFGFSHSFMMYPIVLVEGDRDSLLMHLEERGIETRYLFPLLSQPIYRKLFPGLENNYPEAKFLSEQGFFIGIHQGLLMDDLLYISNMMHEYFNA
jgi:perosamine synthetase